MNPTSIGTSDAKAALQALGKRIIENSTLYHFPKSPDGSNSPSGKKQKLDNNTLNNTNNNYTNNNNFINNRADINNEHGQRDPYLTYEQYENLLYRGKLPAHLMPKQLLILPPTDPSHANFTHNHNHHNHNHHNNNHNNHHNHMDNLISDIPYDSPSPLSTISSIPSTIDTSTLPPSVTTMSMAPLTHHLSTIAMPQMMLSSPASLNMLSQQQHSGSSLHQHHQQHHNISSPSSSSSSSSSTAQHASSHSAPSTPPSTAHAVALLTTAESQKIQRKKANQQEREVLEKYYNDHYVDQSVKIRKEDLTELSFTLNWHVLRVQGWMHTHRQSRSDYNPPKRTKRRATLPQEQDLLKHYFKIWTEQGLIDLNSPTRVTPKDYELVASTLGWDNERVRRWTDHYKQKIKAATEGNP